LKGAFQSAPDFESPTDTSPTNSYIVQVTANDGHGGTDIQTVTVNVTDVSEVPDPNDFDNLSAANPDAGPTTHNDVLNGTSGADTIDTNSGDDTYYGRGGDDDITGNTGNDTLYGQAGNDTIHAGNNNDTVYGGSGNDQIFGEDNNDTLYGGSGNDGVNGGNGNDLIIGGFGIDTLTGGAGNDTFKFLSAADSKPGTSDVITDFGTGDVLDFTAIDAKTSGAGSGGDQAFTLVSGSSVTANALNYYVSGTDTIITGDTDGNTATVEIQLTLQNYTGPLSGATNMLL